MAMNTLTPRLRNSSINGPKFAIDLSPEVQKHLKELNTILGKSSFNVKKKVDLDKLDKLRQELDALGDEVKDIENKAWDADGEARELEKIAFEAQGEAKQADETFHKVAEKPAEAKKAVRDEWDLKAHKAETAFIEAKKARDNANDLREEYNRKKFEFEGLSNEILQSVVMVTNGRVSHGQENFDLVDELNKPLLAKKTVAQKWDPEGVLSFIIDKEQPGLLSISDCIDKVNELSNLKHSFQQYLTAHSNQLSDNQKAVLNRDQFPNVLDYLLAYGYFIKGISDVNAMFNFVQTHKLGAKAVVDYLVVSSARSMIQKSSLQIEPIGGSTYNDDDHPLIKKIVSSGISLHEDVFAADTEKILKDFIANDAEVDLIDIGLGILKIDPDDFPSSYYSPIIGYIRKSTIDIDKDNIAYFLPSFISKAKETIGDTGAEDLVEEVPVESDDDFDIEFVEDERTTIKTNVSNIKCASQLFSSMIMDLELDVFNLTNFLTNNYLIRNRIDLEDVKLRQNLQLFVFSNSFIDSKTKQKTDRTDAGERQHFYRQVFNFGTGPVPQGVIVNYKFPKLWNQLVPAVKDYLEKAADSMSEDTFVSKGGVMQIVSGMHNNLSANCTSMAKIISPIIHAEWNFIITKILGHPEIIKQVSPSVGTWKGVAETLYAEMKQSHIDASLIYDKTRLSYEVLRAVADYNPRTFEEADKFIDFCSLVIQLDDLNQSIVADMNEMPEEEEDSEAAAAEREAYGGNGEISKVPQSANGNAGDWDF